MMENNLAGKKLLVMGGRPAATLDIIRIAKKLNIYTIVTDNLKPEDSPAKAMSDEAWMISTADVDTLEKMVREHGVNGVFTGAHEFNLMRTKELCERCGFPFYATEEQLKLNFDKEHFKAKCTEAGISVPFSYNAEDEDIYERVTYPVIVKPRDGCGGQGITICHNREELEKGIDFAYLHSPGKQAVIEEYVTGREITAVYTIKNGEASLSCFRDRYPTEEFEQVTAQYDLSLIPSRYTRSFFDKDHPKFVQLFKNVHAQNGVVFFQGIANRDKITFFECGYRLNALCDYHNIAQLNGINYLEMMIAFALTGEMSPYDLSMENPLPDSFSGVFNMTARGGVIASQTGIEKVRNMKGVASADYLHVEGDKISNNSGLAQSVFRAHVFADTLEELEKVIHEVQSYIRIVDTDGNDMLFKAFDTKRLFCE